MAASLQERLLSSTFHAAGIALSNLPKVTKLISGRAEIQTLADQLPSASYLFLGELLPFSGSLVSLTQDKQVIFP